MKYTNYIREHALQAVEAMERRNYLRDCKLNVRIYEHAVIVPSSAEDGGGLYFRGNLVDWSNFNGRIQPSYCKDVSYCDDDVLYIGMIFGVWGHCLTDFLRHVWPLLRLKHKKVAYTTVLPNQNVPENYFALLFALGVDRNDVIKVVVPTQFKSVVFCDPSTVSPAALSVGNENVRYYTKEYSETIDAIVGYYTRCIPNVANSSRVIYLSRGNWKRGSVDFGESLVEKAFELCYKCTIVHPETVTLGELVVILSRCDTLIATEGSIAHNSIFLKKGARLIDIRKGDYVNGYQAMINQVRNLDVTYIDANYTYMYPVGSEPWFGPFLLGVNDRLARFLNCRRSSCLELFIPFLKFTSRYAYTRARRMASICKAFFRRKIFHR